MNHFSPGSSLVLAHVAWNRFFWNAIYDEQQVEFAELIHQLIPECKCRPGGIRLTYLLLLGCITPLYCPTACLNAKCCNLIGWILERGPSIHFRIDGPDRSYGFRSKLKKNFWEDDRETINRSREKLVYVGKIVGKFLELSRKT